MLSKKSLAVAVSHQVAAAVWAQLLEAAKKLTRYVAEKKEL